MLPFKRSERVGELMLEEISTLLLREIKDPRIGFVTLTRVQVSDDLRYAKVFVSILGTLEQEQSQTLQGLQSAAKFMRRELGRRLRLKYVPELTFHLDKSIEYGVHIAKVLEEIKVQENHEHKEES